MNIRKEKMEDYNSIYAVVKAAFDNAEHADGNEQDLVEALRKGESYIPALSLVAEEKGLSVLPEYQRKGIGTALIKEGHKIAKDLGYGYSVVLGSEKYYPRVGYVPADTLGITPPFEVSRENFMAYKINGNIPAANGTIVYAKEFGIK